MGLATFGMIGWSVAIPTVGTMALGLWLDRVAPHKFSWTITLLFADIAVGVLIAWRWVMHEHDETVRGERDEH